MRVLDLSNHDFATFDPACLKAAGVERVILGVWDFAIAETMLLALRAAGVIVEDLYGFLYYRLPWENNDILNATELARRHGGITRIWLDCEAMFDGPAGLLDTEAEGTTVADRYQRTRAYYLSLRGLGYSPGIYTGLYWWRDKMGNSPDFARDGAPLWLANYGANDPNAPRDPITLVSFGGWTAVAVHQYSSTIPVCGRNRDHNYWFLEDDVGLSDDDILAIFGSTERDKEGNLRDRAFRLARAKERYAEAVSSGRSVLEVAGTALVEAKAAAKAAQGKLPPGTKVAISGVINGDVTTK